MTTQPKILLSGFDAFGDLHRNTSQVVVETVMAQAEESSNIYSAILPTAYHRSFVALKALMDALKPDFILMLGVAPNSSGIRIEQWAHNQVSITLVDNDGIAPEFCQIVQGACSELQTEIDLQRLHVDLMTQGMTTHISKDCGDYVCNFLYYNVLTEIADKKLPTKAMFVHLPHIFDGRKDEAAALGKVVEGVKQILYFLSGIKSGRSESGRSESSGLAK